MLVRLSPSILVRAAGKADRRRRHDAGHSKEDEAHDTADLCRDRENGRRVQLHEDFPKRSHSL